MSSGIPLRTFHPCPESRFAQPFSTSELYDCPVSRLVRKFGCCSASVTIGVNRSTAALYSLVPLIGGKQGRRQNGNRATCNLPASSCSPPLFESAPEYSGYISRARTASCSSLKWRTGPIRLRNQIPAFHSSCLQVQSRHSPPIPGDHSTNR